MVHEEYVANYEKAPASKEMSVESSLVMVLYVAHLSHSFIQLNQFSRRTDKKDITFHCNVVKWGSK